MNDQVSVKTDDNGQKRRHRHADIVSWQLQDALKMLRRANDSLWSLSVPRIAEALGHEDAGLVERVFYGEIDPPFALVREIAQQLGLNEEWLLFGDGFPFAELRLPLSEPDRWIAALRDDPDLQVYMVRATAGDCDAVFVLRRAKWRCELVSDRLAIHGGIGSGGAGQLHYFRVLVHAIEKAGLDGRVHGREADGQTVSSVIRGLEPPAILTGRAARANLRPSDWWEALGHTMSAADLTDRYGPDFRLAQEKLLDLPVPPPGHDGAGNDRPG